VPDRWGGGTAPNADPDETDDRASKILFEPLDGLLKK
jgi:hypothetical protein